MNADQAEIRKPSSGRFIVVLMVGLTGPVSLILTGPFAVVVAPVASLIALVLFVIALRHGVRGQHLLTLACVVVLLADALILLGIWQMLQD